MKTHKLIVIVAIICLLVGASSAAMARNDCPDGFLVGGTIDSIIINESAACTILGVYVTGDEDGRGIVVRGGGSITIKDSIVEGRLAVIDSGDEVLIEDNEVSDNIVVRGNTGFTLVLRNVVRNGQIRVIDQDVEGQRVEVIENLIFGGNLSVNGNASAAVIENRTDGNITCSDNEELISRNNRGEKVTCGR
ncbi:MAG: hypothetical protein P8X80_09135 [Desulfobacterales bacterium]